MTETTENRAPLGVSQHFPPDVCERLMVAAAHPEPYWRAQQIAAAHAWAVSMYPELFRPGA